LFLAVGGRQNSRSVSAARDRNTNAGGSMRGPMTRETRLKIAMKNAFYLRLYVAAGVCFSQVAAV